jgi:hypothetical protein
VTPSRLVPNRRGEDVCCAFLHCSVHEATSLRARQGQDEAMRDQCIEDQLQHRRGSSNTLVCPEIAARESSELIAVTIPIIRVALEMLSSLAKRGRVEEALF